MTRSVHARPPRVAQALLARLLPAAERAHLLALIDDLHALRRASDGAFRADAWYCTQALTFPLRMMLSAVITRPFPTSRETVSKLLYEPVTSSAD